MRAREIWPKIVEIIEFWKGLPKSKKPGKGKIVANTSYDHICSIQKVIAKTLNSFLVLCQANKLAVPFLAESLEILLRSFYVKFIRKDVLESAKTVSVLIKLDVADKANQKDISSVGLGFGLKYKLKRLIDNKKVSGMQVFQFKKEAMEFLASFCSHAMEKSPPQSLFARYLKCLSPNFMVESSKFCELMFEKILERIVSYFADAAKFQFSHFLSTTVKENKDSFVKLDKETDQVDTFIRQFFLDTNKFILL